MGYNNSLILERRFDMKKGWLFVVLMAGLAAGLNSCCSCPKETTPSAQAAAYQTAQPPVQGSYSGSQAVK